MEEAHAMTDKSAQDNSEGKDQTPEKPAITLPGTVEKIIPSLHPDEPDKAQIAVEGADDLYREIRVENILEDPAGNTVSMKEGTKVEVTIEAEPHETEPKGDSEPSGSQSGQQDQPRRKERKKGTGAG
jgi:hypothetical protein